MAAKVPVITRHSCGDKTLIVGVFSDIDNGDTWASGISEITHYWAVGIDDPTTQGFESVDVSLSGSTFTYSTGEDDRSVNMFVLANI